MDDVRSQTRSPSELQFGSLLVYAPQGIGEESVRSQQVARHIKNCRKPYMERVGLRLAEQIEAGMFGELLGTQVTLVPVPRSSPTVEHMHWPALRICSELAKRGLCKSVDAYLNDALRLRRAHSLAWGRNAHPRPITKRHCDATANSCSRPPASRWSTMWSPAAQPCSAVHGHSQHDSPMCQFVRWPSSGQ